MRICAGVPMSCPIGTCPLANQQWLLQEWCSQMFICILPVQSTKGNSGDSRIALISRDFVGTNTTRTRCSVTSVSKSSMKVICTNASSRFHFPIPSTTRKARPRPWARENANADRFPRSWLRLHAVKHVLTLG